ncbi:MAG: hypothetical protein AB8B59_02075 [Maribacter sp.]
MAFGFDAINVVGNNRTLLKKRKFKDIKKLVLKTTGKTYSQFKEVSPDELEEIKNKIRKEAEKSARREIIIYGFLAILLIIGAGYLSLLIIKMSS